MSHKIFSKFFKAPELIMQFEFYNYSADIWAVGVLLASIVFKKFPFFLGKNLFDILIEITNLLGSDQFLKFHLNYGISLPDKQSFKGSFRKGFEDFVDEGNKHLASGDLLELVKGMLRFDPDERITAREALESNFFKD